MTVQFGSIFHPNQTEPNQMVEHKTSLWAFNYKFKLLVDVVLEYDIKAFLSERFGVWNSVTAIFMVQGMEGSFAASTLQIQRAFVWW